MSKRGSDSELEGTQQIKVLEPWENPTEEIVFGPDSQDLMRGYAPLSREQSLAGVPIIGDAWVGPAIRDVKMHTGEEVGASRRPACATDGGWHRGRGCGQIPGYSLELRRVTFLGAPVGTEYRYTRLAARPTPAPQTRVVTRTRTRIVRQAIPGIAPAVTVDEPVEEGDSAESQDSVSGSPFVDIVGGGAGPQARARLARPEAASLADPKRDYTQSRTVDDRGEVGYWTDLNRYDDMLDTPNWHEIGGGAGPQARARLARPESASLADPKRDYTQSRTVDDRGEVGYGTSAPSSTVAQYGTPPQAPAAPGGGSARSLSSDTIDRINSLNTALQSLPDPSAVAPLILQGLATGRYNGQRAFYHSKDYGEHWGKAMGVLWLASQMTGNEDVVRNMLNEARDRLNDARNKLRDITG